MQIGIIWNPFKTIAIIKNKNVILLLSPLIEKIKGVGYDKELTGPKLRSRESNFFLFLKEKCQTKKLNWLN